MSSLLNISGVGQVKLRQYGEAFLEVIRAFCEKHGLKENPRQQKESKSPSPGGTLRGERDEGELPARTRIVAEEFNSGMTIPALMEQHQVTRGTILEHLTKYLLAGNKLRNGDDVRSLTSVTLKQQQAAFVAFDELGTTYLKPVFDTLNGELNYDELKILRLMYLIAHQ